jgi:hypothetical protein
VFNFSAYSSELNQDKYLNCTLKVAVHAQPPARVTDTLKKNVRSHMDMFHPSPDRVNKYFRIPE